MASYVVHYIMGEQLLNLICNRTHISISCEDKNAFRLGNLIVDVLGFGHPDVNGLSEDEIIEVRKQYREKKILKKIKTHFRSESGVDLLINSPRLDDFISKYGDLLVRDFSVMGYFFHLYIDKVFFEYFYGSVISCLDKNYKPTKFVHDNLYVKINKNRKIISKDYFWNGKHNIYDDYYVLNKYFIQNYGDCFNQERFDNLVGAQIINPGILEVDYCKIDEVLKKMKFYILESKELSNDDMVAFEKEDFLKFIFEQVDCFYYDYQDMIFTLLDSNKFIKNKG